VTERVRAGIRGAFHAVGAPLRFVLVALIRTYRVTLSGALGGQCRFHPSCSIYAEQAIREKGAIRGAALTMWRVLRCNPFGRGGLEPVPGSSGPEYDGIIHRRGPS
jgi:putative membrane protein insertion efficiency factor